MQQEIMANKHLSGIGHFAGKTTTKLNSRIENKKVNLTKIFLERYLDRFKFSHKLKMQNESLFFRKKKSDVSLILKNSNFTNKKKRSKSLTIKELSVDLHTDAEHFLSLSPIQCHTQ